MRLDFTYVTASPIGTTYLHYKYKAYLDADFNKIIPSYGLEISLMEIGVISS